MTEYCLWDQDRNGQYNTTKKAIEFPLRQTASHDMWYTSEEKKVRFIYWCIKIRRRLLCISTQPHWEDGGKTGGRDCCEGDQITPNKKNTWFESFPQSLPTQSGSCVCACVPILRFLSAGSGRVSSTTFDRKPLELQQRLGKLPTAVFLRIPPQYIYQLWGGIQTRGRAGARNWIKCVRLVQDRGGGFFFLFSAMNNNCPWRFICWVYVFST